MNIGPGNAKAGVAKIGRGEIVVLEDNINVLCSEDVLAAILAMAELERKSPPKK